MEKTKKFEELRRLAEERLTVRPLPLPDTEADSMRLIHELQVHQVELEMQNDELSRAKEELEESNAKYADLYEFAPVGYFTLDRSGVVIASNRRGENLLGVDRHLLQGNLFSLFVASESRQLFQDYLKRIFAGKALETCELPLALPGGRRIWIRAEGVLSYDGGDCRVAVSDITELKLAEENRAMLEARLHQSQKMEAIGTLAGGIAHDFNNLLGVILGYTTITVDLLPQGSEERENLENVLAASERARELVKQILTFSRKSEKRAVPIEIKFVVRETMRLLDSVIPKTVHIDLDVDPNAGYVVVDPSEIHQLVMNLCINAYQSMPLEGGNLRVTLKRTEVQEGQAPPVLGLASGHYLLLEIEDTGAGMSRETAARIFEPYFTTKGLGNGTGLGLAVVQGIVTGLKGAINVRSAPGEGTTFSVYLPRHDKAEEAADPAQPAIAIHGEGNILFVDDEPLLAQLGKMILESLGYTVRDVSDPATALELFQAHPEGFDLIVTDQTMPGFTGAELAKRVRAIRPGMPVVIASGHSDLIDEARAAELGIAAFLRKPYNRNALGSAVAMALGGGKK